MARRRSSGRSARGRCQSGSATGHRRRAASPSGARGVPASRDRWPAAGPARAPQRPGAGAPRHR